MVMVMARAFGNGMVGGGLRGVVRCRAGAQVGAQIGTARVAGRCGLQRSAKRDSVAPEWCGEPCCKCPCTSPPMQRLWRQTTNAVIRMSFWRSGERARWPRGQRSRRGGIGSAEVVAEWLAKRYSAHSKETICKAFADVRHVHRVVCARKSRGEKVNGRAGVKRGRRFQAGEAIARRGRV